MRHSRLARAAAAGTGSMPGIAFANSGIGFFTPASILLVLAVIPVILVEAPILWWRLGVPGRRALWLSTSANIVSTILGAVIGVAFDLAIGVATGMSGFSGPIGFAIALVPMFALTLWIEWLVIRRMQAGATGVFSAVLAANAVSYVLLAAAALVFVPPDPTMTRSRMTEVINVLGVAKVDAAEYFQANGRFRASTQEAPTVRTRRVRTEDSGRIVAEIALPGNAELDGKIVAYEPEIEDGKIVAWHCYVPEAPHKFFPAACRYRSAAESRRAQQR